MTMLAVADGQDRAGLESLRRVASWIVGAVFAVSFGGLLVLSAGPDWQPENHWVVLFDRLWKASGLTFLALGALPYVVGLVRRVRGLFGDRS